MSNMKNILVFILLLCITSPAVGQRVKKSHEDIVSAAELMYQAYEEEAREILDSLLSVDRNNSDALFLRSLDYWHNGEIHRAIEYCSKAIETHSRRCYYDLDYMYYRLGDMYYSYSINYSNAIENYSIALDLTKKRDYIQRCRILYNRALCYYEIGEYKKAKQDLLSALDCDYDTLKDDILDLLEQMPYHPQA